jgi:MFS family permease
MADENESDSGGRAKRGYAALTVKPFRYWFFAQTFSGAGNSMQMVAMAWVMLKLTHSGLDLGLMTTASGLPLLLLSPRAGILADHHDRRKILLATQAGYVIITSLLGVMVGTGAMRWWMLLIFGACSGGLMAFDSTARQIIAVDLVGEELITSAVGLNEVILNASRVFGPALGGTVLAVSGPAMCCYVNALTFVAPLLVLFFMSHARTGVVRDRFENPASWKDGIAYAWHRSEIRLTLAFAVVAGMLFNLSVPLSLIGLGMFHMDAAHFGFLYTAFGLGGIAGSFLASSGHRDPTLGVVVKLGVLTGLSVLACTVSPTQYLEYGAMAVTGCVSIWFIARGNAFVMLATEPSIRGRVMSAWTMALPGCTPFTSPVVGEVAALFGPRSGIGLIAASFIGLGCSRGRLLLRRDSAR